MTLTQCHQPEAEKHLRHENQSDKSIEGQAGECDFLVKTDLTIESLDVYLKLVIFLESMKR